MFHRCDTTKSWLDDDSLPIDSLNESSIRSIQETPQPRRHRKLHEAPEERRQKSGEMLSIPLSLLPFICLCSCLNVILSITIYLLIHSLIWLHMCTQAKPYVWFHTQWTIRALVLFWLYHLLHQHAQSTRNTGSKHLFSDCIHRWSVYDFG